ncbi:BTAD domain-containing putative transcriptional regulator [Geodermatophilus sp. SYSU D00758]
MSRALRYEPPLPGRDLVLRPRLLAPLHSRFARPLTAVVAPAGFGKTTLLAQAVEENALSPLGEDRWLTCQPDDGVLSFLTSGALAALGTAAPVPETPRAAAVAVAEVMWRAAPRHLALVLDDAHLVDAASPGGRFLAALVEELPRNGHLLVAARPPLPLLSPRLLANGDAVVLSEADLQFRDEEVSAFAGSRAVAPELLSGVGGWPALAELTATAGPSAVTGYVWEELLERLPADRLHALALLVAIGGADEGIAAAVLGREVRLADLLDGLPLVVRGSSGWWSLHALWAGVLDGRLSAGQVARARRTAGTVLARRRRYHDAMHLLVDACAWDCVRDLAVEVCEVGTPLVPPDVLEVWLRRLPPEVRDSAEGLLLAAMVAEPSSPEAAELLLERASAAAPHGSPVAFACLNGLVEVAFRRADRRRMTVFVERLAEQAASGSDRAAGWVALFRALLARDPGEVRAQLAAPGLLAGAPLSPVQDWLRAHLLLLALGEPAEAEAIARRAMASAGSNLAVLFRCQVVESLRLRGRLEEAAQLLPELLAGLSPGKVLTSPELVTCAVVLLDLLGRDAEAEAVLLRHRSVVAASSVAWAPVAGAVAEAFHRASRGEDEGAAAALRGVLHLGLARNPAVLQVSSAALPLLYVLLPEVRARWDADPPAGCFAEVHRVTRALVALREHGSAGEAGRLPPGTGRLARALLPAPWAADLSLGLLATGEDEGRALVEELGSRARDTLRVRGAGGTGPVAVTARRLLRELPAVPHHRLGLRVLGPMELRRDGEVVAAPQLRRERVRRLLGYLLTHDRPTRAAVAADLWPDLDPAAAARNLRVTLAYLLAALEPDRREQDPPYFVRSTGPVLRLVVDGPLEVDSVTFDRLLDDAARLERQGALSAALTGYRRAVDLWRTDYLPDVDGGEWLEWERDRLRGRFVAASVRAGELLLARGGAAPARALAERALGVDRWAEGAYQLLVTALLETGDLVSARRWLGRCTRALDELGVPPHPRTVALARRLDGPRPGRAGAG